MRPSTPRLSSPFLLLLTLVAQLVHAIDISIDDEGTSSVPGPFPIRTLIPIPNFGGTSAR